MLKRKCPYENHQMLPLYEGEYPNKITSILSLQKKFQWKLFKKWFKKDDIRGHILQ